MVWLLMVGGYKAEALGGGGQAAPCDQPPTPRRPKHKNRFRGGGASPVQRRARPTARHSAPQSDGVSTPETRRTGARAGREWAAAF